jgi:hypothetical protein
MWLSNNKGSDVMAYAKKEDELSYIAKYQKEKYDRITVMAPKGTKDELRKAAELKSMKLSAFILDCVNKELERMKK